jgi:hypothetical protein
MVEDCGVGLDRRHAPHNRRAGRAEPVRRMDAVGMTQDFKMSESGRDPPRLLFRPQSLHRI